MSDRIIDFKLIIRKIKYDESFYDIFTKLV